MYRCCQKFTYSINVMVFWGIVDFLAVFQGVMIVKHTSLTTLENKNWCIGLNLFLIFSNPHRVKGFMHFKHKVSSLIFKNIQAGTLGRPFQKSNVSLFYPFKTSFDVVWDHQREFNRLWPHHVKKHSRTSAPLIERFR